MKEKQTKKQNEAEAVKPATAGTRQPQFVMNIEGLGSNPPAPEQPILTGATKSLPDQDALLLQELHTILEESPAETAPAEAPGAPAAESGAAAVVEAAVAAAAKATEAAPAEPTPAAESAPSQEPASAEETLRAEEAEEEQEAPTDPAEQPKPTEERAAEAGQEKPDDDALLAELYALIGDGDRARSAAHPAAPGSARPAQPVHPEPEHARITQEDLQFAPLEEDLELEADGTGVPGWLKGLFLLLVSLALGGMTLYTVAADVLGKVF